MSSRCNVGGCSNDRRYKDRWVVLPHVHELQFHKPSPEDYDKWEKKLDRVDYSVSKNTRVCSNHFKHAKPLHNSHVPSLHLRTYPSWAVPVKKVEKDINALPDGIVCEVLSHMCKYADGKELQPLFKEHLQCDFPIDQDFPSVAIGLDKSLARAIIPQVFPLIPIGKCLECLAIYQHGVEIEGMKFPKLTPPPSAPDSASSFVVQSSTSHSVEDFHSYCGTTTAQGTSRELDHSYVTEECSDNLQKRIAVCTQAAKHPKTCRKTSCKKKISSLESKVASLQKEVERLKRKVQLRTRQRNEKQDKINCMIKEQSKVDQSTDKLPKISINTIKDSDCLIALHTGLPSYSVFKWLFDEVSEVASKMTYWDGSGYEPGNSSQKKKPGRARSVCLEDELLITLIKLKLNLSGDYIAFLFGLTPSTVSSIISTWIPMLSKELEGLIYWPSREEVKACYPACFKKWSGVTAILDCFEIPTEKPSHVEANSQVFSQYKNRPTSKFLLACTPGGSISYISPAAGGNMSDKEMVMKCNIPQKFSPGDKCMVDKGFRIEGELLEHGVQLIIPPFVKQGKPFTEEQNNDNKSIAHARIHVERVIGRVRDYNFVNGIIPVNQLDLVSPAVKVCCVLTNLKQSVVNPH